MTHYRIYELDRDGRIIAGHDADCGSGDLALREGAANVGAEAEVWEGARLVGRVAASSHSAVVGD